MTEEEKPEYNQTGGVQSDNLNPIPAHTHDGKNSPAIDPKNLLGFPIETSVPTDNTLNGTFRLGYVSSVAKLFAFINSTWQTLSFSAPDQIVQNYAKADSSISAGDTVSYLPGGSTDFFIYDLGGTNLEVGKQSNPSSHGDSFIAPFSITGFSCTISIKKQGSTSSTVNVNLKSSSSDLPGTTIETQTISSGSITGSFTSQTVTFTSAITAGTAYWITVDKQGSLDASNHYLLDSALNFNAKYPGFSTLTHSASFDGSTWNSGTTPFKMTLTKTLTAGLYRMTDVANNAAMHGSVVGIAKTVNSSDCDVVTSGKYQSSGTPYTAGENYYSSATAGGLSTSGNVLIGRATSTSTLDVYSNKTVAMPLTPFTFTMGSSPQTFSIMTGFKVNYLHGTFKDSGYAWVGDRSGGLKQKNGANSSKAGFWDNEDSGVGSSGTRTTAVTYNKSNINVSVSSSAATLSSTGSLTFLS